MREKFITVVMRGDPVTRSDLNDRIQDWHESDSTLGLMDYLGVTIDEFEWIVDGKPFDKFLEMLRKNRKNLEKFAEG